eukprot:CAMPEP_0184504982 /NCGR_PEP_ID=MMETSP0113_2-20130426/52659_1 /TAXON_ID=91329 /ORGANISM="Norrisiella sphaerica, Strain BC52" /LENGTH=527 /DNA_ID=CAMNT_0026894645 /DNA_START=280 /DNA_END=1863 /DNA_ORIENTATION=-
MDLHLRNNAATHSLLLLGRIDAQEREKRKLSARMLALEKSIFAITEFLANLEQDTPLQYNGTNNEEKEGAKPDSKPKSSLSEIIRNLHQELARAKMTPDVKPLDSVFSGPKVSLDSFGQQEPGERVSHIHSHIPRPISAPPDQRFVKANGDGKGSSTGTATTSSDSDDVQVEIQIHNPGSLSNIPEGSSAQKSASAYKWPEEDEDEDEHDLEPKDDERDMEMDEDEDNDEDEGEIEGKSTNVSRDSPEERDRTAETLAQMSEICASLSPKVTSVKSSPSSGVRSSSLTRSRTSKRPRRSTPHALDLGSSPKTFTDRVPSSQQSDGVDVKKPPVRSSTPRSTRPRRERGANAALAALHSGSRTQNKGRRGFKLGIDKETFRAQTQQAAKRVQQLMDEEGKIISRKRKSRSRSLKQKLGLNAFEAPKKPKTAYNYYQIGVRESILKELLRESGGNIGSKEVQSQKIARVIGERWKAMPEHERQIFNNLAAKDKERYKRDLDDYVRLNKQLEMSRKQTSQGKGNTPLPGA